MSGNRLSDKSGNRGTGKCWKGWFWKNLFGKKANLEKAVQNAIQCFEDGLVRIFQGDVELTQLKQTVLVKEGDCFTFIRLTFLAGRLW